MRKENNRHNVCKSIIHGN